MGAQKIWQDLVTLCLDKWWSITDFHSYIFHELTRIQVYMRVREIVLRDCSTRFDSSKILPSLWLNICTLHPFLKSRKEGSLLIFLPHSSLNLWQACKLNGTVFKRCAYVSGPWLVLMGLDAWWWPNGTCSGLSTPKKPVFNGAWERLLTATTKVDYIVIQKLKNRFQPTRRFSVFAWSFSASQRCNDSCIMVGVFFHRAWLCHSEKVDPALQKSSPSV